VILCCEKKNPHTFKNPTACYAAHIHLFFVSEIDMLSRNCSKTRTSHQFFELYLVSLHSKSVPTSCNQLLQAAVKKVAQRKLCGSGLWWQTEVSAGRYVTHLVGDAATSDRNETLI